MLRNTIAVVFTLLMSTQVFANYVGSEVQYFNPTADNMDFFTVHSSRTLPKGTVKTTLFFDYAENIHYSSAFENNVLQAQLGVGVGITDKLSFSITGSGIVDYSDDVGGKYTEDNFTHVRTSLKYRFCGCSKGGWALVANIGYGLMDPDYFVGDDNDLSASLTVAWDRQISDAVRFAVNLGYRYQNSKDAMVAAPGGYAAVTTTPRDGSNLIASVGLNFAVNSRLTGVTELYANLPTDQLFEFTVDPDTYQQKGAEVLLGANYSMTDRLDIGFGGTVGVFSDAQNADWRAFLGMGYAFGGEAEDAAFNLAGSGAAPAPAAPQITEAVKEEVKIEDAPVLKSFDITAKFPSGSSNLSAAAKGQIAAAGTYLKSSKYKMIFVEGHTDSQGAESFNQMLSERRAQMVKNALVRTHGVSADKIKVVGFGETAPIADNATAAGRAKNRRVTVKVK